MTEIGYSHVMNWGRIKPGKTVVRMNSMIPKGSLSGTLEIVADFLWSGFRWNNKSLLKKLFWQYEIWRFSTKPIDTTMLANVWNSNGRNPQPSIWPDLSPGRCASGATIRSQVLHRIDCTQLVGLFRAARFLSPNNQVILLYGDVPTMSVTADVTCETLKPLSI